MFTIIIYTIALVFLGVSYAKDKQKTKQGLLKGYKALTNIMPEFLTVLFIIGLSLAAINPEVISRFIGSTSGILGIAIASIVGAITLIPGFVAFPLAKSLLDYGAGLVPIAAFVSTLMMVGIVTIPLEKKYFGTKITLTRNILAFGFSIIIALLMGAMPWVV